MPARTPVADDLDLQALAVAIPLTEREVHLATVRLNRKPHDARRRGDRKLLGADPDVESAVERLLAERVGPLRKGGEEIEYLPVREYADTPHYKAAVKAAGDPDKLAQMLATAEKEATAQASGIMTEPPVPVETGGQ